MAMKRMFIQNIFGCCIMTLLSAEEPRKLTVIPIYGVPQQPPALAFVQRNKNIDVSHNNLLQASFIGDIEHPRSRDAERRAPQVHQIEMQKVRMGEQRCYTKQDQAGGEMHVTKLDHVDASNLSLRDNVEEFKNLVRRTLGRYYDESSGDNLVVAIVKGVACFDEVAKMFIDCRTVVGLSSRMPRTPHISYIVLDHDVSLDDLLKESWSSMISAYQRRLKALDERMPSTEPARSIYQRNIVNIQNKLKHEVNCALITIDDAQELLRRGHQPVFVAYQRDSVV